MSAALPDRYGGKPTDDGIVTNNFMVSMGIAIGACGLAVMSTSIGVRTGEFYSFANFFLDVLNQTQFVVFASVGALVLGFLAIVTGAIISFTGLFVSRYPKCVYFAYPCLLALAAGNIAAGALVQTGITQLNNAIYAPQQVLAQNDVVNITFTQKVTHLQQAIFNGCCASGGLSYSKELYDGSRDPNPVETQDLSGIVKFCGGISAGNYESMVLDKLKPRSCFRDQELFRQFNFTVEQNVGRICQTLRDARVNIAGKKVPGFASTEVTALTERQEVIPIVATHLPNYGCGGGYSKIFQAAMLIWAENFLTPVATNFLICGSIYAVLLVLGVVSTYSCGKKFESAEEKYARYLEEIQNSSSSAAKNFQVVDAFEQSNPNRLSAQNPGVRLSVPNSQRMSVQSHATQGSQGGYQATPARQEFAFNVDDKI